MRPNVSERRLESGGALSSGAFGLSAKPEDQAILLSILRDRLYSNKILAVLREYSANAWDAHIEAGKPDVPIKVSLPTRLQPELVIRDYGFGLSEEDIYTVFTQYGASTKRQTDDQAGMYGIGAKSAFAYSDTFIVTSFHGGMRKTYVAALGANQLGDMTKLDEGPSDETGIEIRIPAKPDDEDDFIQEARSMFAFFRPRPVINTKLVDVREHAIETPVGFLTRNQIADFLPRWAAVMGCIPYRVDFRSAGLTETLTEFVARFAGCLYFNLGEVDISASREELEYTDRTKKAIRERLEVLVSKQSEIVREEVLATPPGLKRRQRARQIVRKYGLRLDADLNYLLDLQVRLFPKWWGLDEEELADMEALAGSEEEKNQEPPEVDEIPKPGELVVIRSFHTERLAELQRARDAQPKTFQLFSSSYGKRNVVDLERTNYVDVCDEGTPSFFYYDVPPKNRLKYYRLPIRYGPTYFLKPINGATFEQVAAELDALSNKAGLEGWGHLERVSTQEYVKPTFKRSVTPHHYRRTFLWNGHTESQSTSWVPLDDEVPFGGVYVVLRSFSCEPRLTEIKEHRDLLRRITLQPLPRLYGVKSTPKHPAEPEKLAGIQYMDWLRGFCLELLEEPDVRSSLTELLFWEDSHAYRIYAQGVAPFEKALGAEHRLVRFLNRAVSRNSLNYKKVELWRSVYHLMKSQLGSQIEVLRDHFDPYEAYPLLPWLPDLLSGTDDKPQRINHVIHYVQLVDKYGTES